MITPFFTPVLMPVKPAARYVFTLGRPGSGKSSIGRFIMETYGRAYSIIKLNDYLFLWEMFMQQESGLMAGQQWFRRTEKDGAVGFEIINRRVLSLALARLNQQARRYLHEPKLVIIEFARSDYRSIVEHFEPEILQHAHVLFMRTSLETCARRIDSRVKEGLYVDDRLVPEDVLRTYYADDGLASLLSVCKPDQVSVIHNEGQKQNTRLAVQGCLDSMLYRVHQPAVGSLAQPRQFGTPVGNSQYQFLPI